MNITPAMRVGLALVVLQKLREAIEQNGNVYSGGLVPNLTSVSDVLTLSDTVLQDQIARYPDLKAMMPTADLQAQLQACWDE